jgi:hypothetical protein
MMTKSEKREMLVSLMDAVTFDDDLTFKDLGEGRFAWCTYSSPDNICEITPAGEGEQEYFFAAVDALREMVNAGKLGARRRANEA